jgi:hypothetical protein
MYINLNQSQVQQLMLFTKDFNVSFALARAYGLNDIHQWIG